MTNFQCKYRGSQDRTSGEKAWLGSDRQKVGSRGNYSSHNDFIVGKNGKIRTMVKDVIIVRANGERRKLLEQKTR